jgi:hypothetical protein
MTHHSPFDNGLYADILIWIRAALASYAESLPFPQPFRTRYTWRIPNPSYHHDQPTEIDRIGRDEIEWMPGKVSRQPIVKKRSAS